MTIYKCTGTPELVPLNLDPYSPYGKDNNGVESLLDLIPVHKQPQGW